MSCVRRKRYVRIIPFICAATISFYLLLTLPGKLWFKKPDERAVEIITERSFLRKFVAFALRDFMKVLLDSKEIMSLEIPFMLLNISSILDPRLVYRNAFQQTEHNMNFKNNILLSTDTVSVENKSFFGNDSSVEMLPVQLLITVIIDAMDTKVDYLFYLDALLGQIQSLGENISVIICAKTNLMLPQQTRRHVNIKLKLFSEKISRGNIYNSIVQSVTTPYILLVPEIITIESDLRYFRKHFSIISSSPSVGVIGGSYRFLEDWTLNCYHNNILHNVLTYYEGFSLSFDQCILCDYMLGPFLVKTHVLRNVSFQSSPPNYELFADWFLKLKVYGIYSLHCPDIVYFTQDSVPFKTLQLKQWKNIGYLWDVQKIIFPTGNHLEFSCKEMNVTCNPKVWFKWYMLPWCCLKELFHFLTLFQELFNKNNLTYAIKGGTLITSVKLQSYAPWEEDGGILLQLSDYKKFCSLLIHFHTNGISVKFLSIFKIFTEKIVLGTPDISWDIVFIDNISRPSMPSDIQHIPTKMKFIHFWLESVGNPGLYCINRNGHYLRHSPSWKHLHMPNWTVTYNKSPSWIRCPTPSHPSCLDQYPNDGNEMFLF